MDAVLEADTRAVIGEGPLWDEENGRLYWVDILGSELHIFDPEEKINRSIKFKSFVTALAKYSKDELIMTVIIKSLAARSSDSFISNPLEIRMISKKTKLKFGNFYFQPMQEIRILI